MPEPAIELPKIGCQPEIFLERGGEGKRAELASTITQELFEIHTII